MDEHKFFSRFMRDIIFGAEDGLVSILGLVIGVAEATSSTSSILISGFAGAAAASVSMAAGNYISTKSQKEVLQSEGKKSSMINPMASAVIIGGTFLIVSIFPILPFLIFNSNLASIVSILVTFAVLFSIGVAKTHITKRNPLKSGVEMIIVAGIAVIVGYLVGRFFSITGI